jgi:hypothetical protein
MLSTTNSVSIGQRGASSRTSCHHLVVDVQAARGIDEQHVVDTAPGFRQGVHGDLERCLLARGGDVDLELLAQPLELQDGRRPSDVRGHEQDAFFLACLQPQRELRGRGGLAGALQARQQHDGRRLRRRLSGRTPSPMTRTSSSWMILIRACPGVRLF